jgi:hypothetical protein
MLHKCIINLLHLTISIHYNSILCPKIHYIFAVVQVIEALCFKPEGRGFDSL